MMKNFLQKICRLKCQYTLVNREKQCLEHIRKVVGTQDVLVLCSGGVDSTVCAALCTKALGAKRVVSYLLIKLVHNLITSFSMRFI